MSQILLSRLSRKRLLIIGASLCLLIIATAAVFYGNNIAHGSNPTVTTPTNVNVTATGPQSITLSWSASTDNSGTGDAPAYYVYNGSNIVATSMGTAVTVSSLNAGTGYTFTVQGYDKDGNSSAQSAAVTATTQAGGAPAFQKIAYFDQWGIYGNAYYPATVASSGAAAQLTPSFMTSRTLIRPT